ncbi:MAG: hypothetical protein E6Q62_08975 [Nitrosomonas sp.]|nr:MAG: hypothetical protein E6Q62_08975 [Nitrosomonas sp.]
MKHFVGYARSTTLFIQHSKRWGSGLLLIALLVMHAKIMLEGCLVTPYLSALPQSTVQMDGPCAETESTSSTGRVCQVHCEYSVNVPKFAGEISLLDNIVALPAIFLALFVFANILHRTLFATLRSFAGPPLYLLFLRLFIPTPPSRY